MYLDHWLIHHGLFLRELLPPDYLGETVTLKNSTEATQLNWIAPGFVGSIYYVLSPLWAISMPVKHCAEGGVYWNPTRPGVPQVAALLGNSPVRFASSSWLASVHLPHSPFVFFFSFLVMGCLQNFSSLWSCPLLCHGQVMEQQVICLLAVKIAKAFLDGFELRSMYDGCQGVSNGQRERVSFVWQCWRISSFYVQKQGTVCKVSFINGKLRLSLY